MTPISILIGLAVLLSGRRIFWLFVCGVGFAIGATLTSQFVLGRPEWVGITLAILSGIMGALVAIYVQRFAVVMAGFASGGVAAIQLMTLLNFNNPPAPWPLFLVGGIVGAILLLVLFDRALIALSSFVGAYLVIQSLGVDPSLTVLLYAALVVLGVAVQSRSLRRTRTQRGLL